MEHCQAKTGMHECRKMYILFNACYCYLVTFMLNYFLLVKGRIKFFRPEAFCFEFLTSDDVNMQSVTDDLHQRNLFMSIEFLNTFSTFYKNVL